MPELKCTVQTCVHNDQYLCRLDKIRSAGTMRKIRRRHAVTVSRSARREVIQILCQRLLTVLMSTARQ